MITTERFNTLIQDQTASGHLTPIDNERDLSEIRGGGGTVTEGGLKGTVNLETGEISGSAYVKITKGGVSFEGTIKQNDIKQWIFEYELKKAQEAAKKEPKPTPTPTPTPPTTPGTAPKTMIVDSLMFARWI